MDVSIMKGMTLRKISVEDNDKIFFCTTEGRHFLMYHRSDCCEYVVIDDICGKLENLLNVPLLVSEEVSSEHSWESDYKSSTWTFYKFATVKGWVDIRWYGTSNGYYSEKVHFEEIKFIKRKNKDKNNSSLPSYEIIDN